MSQEIFDRNVDSLAFYMWKYFNKNSVQEYSQQLKKAKKIGRRYFPFYAKADYILMKEIPYIQHKIHKIMIIFMKF